MYILRGRNTSMNKKGKDTIYTEKYNKEEI